MLVINLNVRWHHPHITSYNQNLAHSPSRGLLKEMAAFISSA